MSEIKSLHRKMQSWFAREKKNGFRSPEVEHAATYVLHGLYSFALTIHIQDCIQYLSPHSQRTSNDGGRPWVSDWYCTRMQTGDL